MKKIKITEKDIFNYVFNPELLEKEIIDHIARGSYSRELEFYYNLKASLDLEINDQFRKKISSRIPAYKDFNPVRLIHIAVPDTESEAVRLAADTPEKDSLIESKTFVSDDKQYLVRFIQRNDTSSVYVFSSNSEPVKNFTLTLQPSGRKYDFEDNNSPLILKERLTVDSVDISFH